MARVWQWCGSRDAVRTTIGPLDEGWIGKDLEFVVSPFLGFDVLRSLPSERVSDAGRCLHLR